MQCISLHGSVRDLDDTGSVEDITFETERGSMSSVNSSATVCTIDSNSSAGSAGKVLLLLYCLLSGNYFTV